MPSMKVEGDSDGDGDMSGGDTERSGGSSRGPDRDSSAEEADEPDSDDSSEMDESECERRRNECLDNLANLERQFNLLREQLYNERVKHVEHQLAEVRGGRSQEYLGPLRRLQENMRIRIEVAGVLRQMRLENVKHICEAEEQAAHQNFKNDVPYSAANQENEIIYISQDSGAVQFSIPETPVNKSVLNNNSNSSALESKLDGLTEKVNLLSENIIIVQRNQEELYKTQQDILFSLANINTQFEELIKKVHVQPEVKENYLTGFKRISDKESFDNFEKMLEDGNLAKDLSKKMSAICGTHRGKGINNAYALIDVLFERKFLQQCSWAGGSRTNSEKISFRSHSNILNFFFTVINKTDENFSLLDTQKFFKVILRNSRQRCESQQERTAVTKPKKHKTIQGVQLLPEQKHVNPEQCTILPHQKSADVDPLTNTSEQGFVTLISNQSVHLSQKQPTEALPKSIWLPEISNTAPLIQEVSREVFTIANQLSEKLPAQVGTIVQPGFSGAEPSIEIIKQISQKEPVDVQVNAPLEHAHLEPPTLDSLGQ